MSHLSESMLMSLMREGATIILPRDAEIENTLEENTLEDSFKSSLMRRRRKVLPITTNIIPSPVPG